MKYVVHKGEMSTLGESYYIIPTYYYVLFIYIKEGGIFD